jgi:hypothetical protein
MVRVKYVYVVLWYSTTCFRKSTRCRVLTELLLVRTRLVMPFLYNRIHVMVLYEAMALLICCVLITISISYSIKRLT